MRLTVRVRDDITVLTPSGLYWGGEETDELESKIEELARAGNRKLLVNLARTTYMTTPAIGVLIAAYKDHKARGAELRLCCVGRSIDQIFVIAGLCVVFGDDQYETEEEAIASFTRGEPESVAVSSARSSEGWRLDG